MVLQQAAEALSMRFQQRYNKLFFLLALFGTLSGIYCIGAHERSPTLRENSKKVIDPSINTHNARASFQAQEGQAKLLFGEHVENWTPFHEYFSLYHSCESCPRVDKWEPYFNAYHRHFERFRGKSVTFVEVGVQSGGSALMWRWYFGENLRYIGIDVNPNVKKFESDWATIVLGDQASENFWVDFKKQFPEPIDIFLDDGGHTMPQQLQTITSAYSLVRPGGVFVCEDLETSYVPEFGGNPDFRVSKSDTMVGFSKSFVDFVNGPSKYVNADELEGLESEMVKMTDSVHFYSQIVFLEKSMSVREPKRRLKFGKAIPYSSQPPWDPPEPLSLDMLPELS